MADKDSSTLKSYVDSAVGTAQSTFGNLTGNTADQAKGEVSKGKAQAAGEDSHTVGKLGPVSFTPSGGVSSDDPRRTQGQYDQTVGSAKETFGNLIGNEGLKKSGAEQNTLGKGTEAEGQLSDFGKGAADRAKGAVGGAFAGLTGDREGQEKYQTLHDDGKAGQRGAEADIQKQADA